MKCSIIFCFSSVQQKNYIPTCNIFFFFWSHYGSHIVGRLVQREFQSCANNVKRKRRIAVIFHLFHAAINQMCRTHLSRFQAHRECRHNGVYWISLLAHSSTNQIDWYLKDYITTPHRATSRVTLERSIFSLWSANNSGQYFILVHCVFVHKFGELSRTLYAKFSIFHFIGFFFEFCSTFFVKISPKKFELSKIYWNSSFLNNFISFTNFAL